MINLDEKLSMIARFRGIKLDMSHIIEEFWLGNEEINKKIE